MTCRHVLDVIDAGPFGNDRRALLDAARSHAAGCPTCGPALLGSEVLTVGLRGLARPAAPAHLKATVMARITNADLTAYEQGAVVTGARNTSRDWSGLAPLAGLAVGLAIVVPTSIAAGDVWRVWNTGGLAAFGAVPQATLATLSMVLGLAVFVGGLLVPLARRRR